MSKKELYLIGAGGHASVILDALEGVDLRVSGVITNDAKESFQNIPILGNDEFALSLDPKKVEFVLGVGTINNSGLRSKIYTRYKELGFSFVSVKHNSAVISSNANLAEGCQVLAGAIVGPGANIGANTIINNRALIEHHCEIGAHCHVGPGAVVCGGVRLGEGSFIGAGSTTIQGVEIGAEVLVAAGATVVCNILNGARVKGTPAK
jgi:sugar O-acyltransferase (sialic acid O-acetyltransferase NeuD family)